MTLARRNQIDFKFGSIITTVAVKAGEDADKTAVTEDDLDKISLTGLQPLVTMVIPGLTRLGEAIVTLNPDAADNKSTLIPTVINVSVNTPKGKVDFTVTVKVQMNIEVDRNVVNAMSIGQFFSTISDIIFTTVGQNWFDTAVRDAGYSEVMELMAEGIDADEYTPHHSQSGAGVSVATDIGQTVLTGQYL